MKEKASSIISSLAQKLLPCCKNETAAQTESWWLLEKLTGKNQADLITLDEIELSQEQEKTLEKWVTLRVEKHEPLQYILGTVPFCNLEILVEPPILIPRPETEEWCAWLIEKLKPVADQALDILDLGAGSGCIALALAKALPRANVVAIDIHPDAIKLCEKNKIHNKISNVTFLQSDLYKAIDKKFDLIVSNPPYISQDEFKTLSPQVTEWEDKTALVANEDGFSVHKRIIDGANKFLKQESILAKHNLARLVIEFGKGQETEIQKLLTAADFTNIQIHKDLEGVQRWVCTITPPLKAEARGG